MSDPSVLDADSDPIKPAREPLRWCVQRLVDIGSFGGAALVFAANGQSVQANLNALRPNSISGNHIVGTPNSGAILNNNPIGTKDGDAITGFGFGVFASATASYACTGFGFAVLNKLTTGHSITASGYQCALNMTTGLMNTLSGVDVAYLSTNMRRSTVTGHHCMNAANYSGEGAIVTGQQTARYLETGDYLNIYGKDSLSNSPGTGTDRCEVFGGANAITASVNKAQIYGSEIFSIGDTVELSFLGGYRNHFAWKGALNTVSIGAFGFFRSAATTAISQSNTGVGVEHGFNVSGVGSSFFGFRAGRRSANTTVNGAVCIGNLSGFDLVESGDLYIGNSNALTAHLIWGNFNSKNLKLRANHLSFVDCQDCTNDAAAATAGLLVGELYFNTTSNSYTKRRS